VGRKGARRLDTMNTGVPTWFESAVDHNHNMYSSRGGKHVEGVSITSEGG